MEQKNFMLFYANYLFILKLFVNLQPEKILQDYDADISYIERGRYNAACP